MECDVAREVLSAQLDDEATFDEAEVATTHLSRCPACRVWGPEGNAYNRMFLVCVAETIPDVATTVLCRSHLVSDVLRQ